LRKITQPYFVFPSFAAAAQIRPGEKGWKKAAPKKGRENNDLALFLPAKKDLPRTPIPTWGRNLCRKFPGMQY